MNFNNVITTFTSWLILIPTLVNLFLSILLFVIFCNVKQHNMLCNFNDKIPYQNEQLPINLIITFVLIFKTQIIPQSRKVLVLVVYKSKLIEVTL